MNKLTVSTKILKAALETIPDKKSTMFRFKTIFITVLSEYSLIASSDGYMLSVFKQQHGPVDNAELDGATFKMAVPTSVIAEAVKLATAIKIPTIDITAENVTVANTIMQYDPTEFVDVYYAIPLKSDEALATDSITYNATYMARFEKIGKIMGFDSSITLKMYGKSKPIIVKFVNVSYDSSDIYDDYLGLIMPIKSTDDSDTTIPEWIPS